MTLTNCRHCHEEVEMDVTGKFMLNAHRDKVKHPKALHICSGRPASSSLTAQFKAGPQEFLKSHVIVVDEHEQMVADANSVCNFKLTSAGKNAVLLNFHNGADDDFITAYWLPWRSQTGTSMDLGAEADFFFTSEMTNCRFSILEENSQSPKVAHVAGDLPSSARRNTAEVESGFCTNQNKTRARRLSTYNSQRRKPFRKPAIEKQHDYTGQQGDPSNYSSAFVFGHRDSASGWKFFAQVVKGSMVEGFFNNELTEDLQVLNFITL